MGPFLLFSSYKQKLPFCQEDFDRHQLFFPTDKQYVKIKLIKNETNRWSIFFSLRRNIGKTLI